MSFSNIRKDILLQANTEDESKMVAIIFKWFFFRVSPLDDKSTTICAKPNFGASSAVPLTFKILSQN